MTLGGMTASVLVNGWTGRPFALDAGVCQGDPLSPALFALAIEPLAAALRASLRGVALTSFTAKTLLFADDLAAAVRDEDDVVSLFRLIGAYEEASGAKLAAAKSFI
jgi:hypothetical protein